jgi:zinc protease
MKVVFVRHTAMPVAIAHLVVHGGCAGVAAADHEACDLLDGAMQTGTKSHDARGLAEAFQALGAMWGVETGSDEAGGYVYSLVSTFDASLALFADVIRHPALDPAEVAIVRERVASRKAEASHDLDSLARAAGPWSTYGKENGHGWWNVVPSNEVERVTVAQLHRTYDETFHPDGATVVVVGDLDEGDARVAVASAFGGAWGGTPSRQQTSSTPHPVGPRAILVDRPGATQSMVQLTDLVLPADSPDRYAFDVMRYIFGGNPITGRISKNLREAKGFTYGVTADVIDVLPPAKGRFRAGGKVQADRTGASIALLIDEARRIRSSDVTDEELAEAKAKLSGVVGDFEGALSTQWMYVELVEQGLPLDTYATWVERIAAVTPADVRRAANEYLRPDAMKVVVVGDRAVVLPQLRELGIGEPLVVDSYGRVVSPRR